MTDPEPWVCPMRFHGRTDRDESEYPILHLHEYKPRHGYEDHRCGTERESVRTDE